MVVFVFSCATISTLAGNSTLPLTWSPWLCVLMTVVTGLGVSSPILLSIGCPHPASFVSTTTTPLAVTKTAVFPPPPFSTNRLSLILSTVTTLGVDCPPCWYAPTVSENAPIVTSAPRTMALLMSCRTTGSGLRSIRGLFSDMHSPPRQVAGSIGQLERENRRAAAVAHELREELSKPCTRRRAPTGRGRHVLLSVHGIRDRSASMARPGLKRPQRFAGSRVERGEISFRITEEEQVAGGGDQRREQRVFGVPAPDSPAGERFICIQMRRDLAGGRRHELHRSSEPRLAGNHLLLACRELAAPLDADVVEQTGRGTE